MKINISYVHYLVILNFNIKMKFMNKIEMLYILRINNARSWNVYLIFCNLLSFFCYLTSSFCNVSNETMMIFKQFRAIPKLDTSSRNMQLMRVTYTEGYLDPKRKKNGKSILVILYWEYSHDSQTLYCVKTNDVIQKHSTVLRVFTWY